MILGELMKKVKRKVNRKRIAIVVLIPVICIALLIANFTSIRLSIKGYHKEDKKVVLGLITTKTPELEDKETVIKRIHEAAKFIPLDRLYLSPQCGFASCAIGNKLTEEQQWAKLKLVKEIAEEVWG